MYKASRIMINPYCLGRRARLFALTSILCSLLVIAARWSRELSPSTLTVLPPLRERNLDHLRRSRHLSSYIDKSDEPLITPQSGYCASQEDLAVVALVSSSPRNAEERGAVRATWGRHVPTYFFIGRTNSGELNVDEDMVSHYMEAKQHGDLVVGDYVDSYENLTLKSAHMLGWATRHCARASFLFKTDDDVMVNPWVLAEVVSEHRGRDLVGYRFTSRRPHRDRESKWYLPAWLYGADLIPEYLSGTGYLVNGDRISQIIEESYKVPLINLEDVYITYLVSKNNLNLTLTHDRRLSPYKPLIKSKCSCWSLASMHSLTPNQMLYVWPKIYALAEEYTKESCYMFNIFFGFDIFLV